MPKMARWMAVIVLLGCCTVGAAQVPPETVLDRYQVKLEESLARGDFEAAMAVMRKMILLRTLGVRLSAGFYWEYAQVAIAVRDFRAAVAGLERYLELVGPAGTHYDEARLLLSHVKRGRIG